MGYALITDNLTKGRYTITLDFGDANRNQRAIQLGISILKLGTRLATAQISLASAQSLYDASKVALEAFIGAWSSSGAPIAPGTPAGKEHEQLLKAALFYGIQRQQAQSAVASLKLLITKQQKALTALLALPLIQSRQAWCIDLTENAAGYVSTAEIPGESNLVLIRPGAPAWKAGDGVLVAREVMGPNQAYFNAAILPGWQKYKPTFRAGTILELNKPENKASVQLNEHKSSAQRLPVDQKPTLTGVPVTYMTCHAEAFEVGDRVVVMFDDQDQSKPRVIGFVTDPKSCNWPCFFANGGYAYFGSKILSVFDALLSGTTTVRIKFVDGGVWLDMILQPGSTATQFIYYDPTPGPGVFNFTILQIQRVISAFNGYNDFIALAVSPFSPATTTRRVAEVAVYSNGRLVCNVAATDHGLVGSANYQSGLVKTSGGIALVGFSHPITPLTYTLTAQ